MEQFVRMIVNQVMRQIVRRGVNAGFDRLSGGERKQRRRAKGPKVR